MLELKNVSFEVSDEKAQKEIIRGINLKIDDNKFVVITGPNGGGNPPWGKMINCWYRETNFRSDFI